MRSFFVALVSLFLSACVSIAPPISSAQYGAPGRMQEGIVEVGAEAIKSPDSAGGAPRVGYGITDSITIETGGEVFENRAMGWVGTRWTPFLPTKDYALLIDVEGGLGGGLVQHCNNGVCSERFTTNVGGAYFGVGFGGKIKFFSPWFRFRSQATAASGIPITSISTWMFGLQFSIVSFAYFYAGTGAALFVNENLTWFGWFPISGGLSFTIPTTKKQ